MIKTVRLLRTVPQVREKYNNRFRYLWSTNTRTQLAAVCAGQPADRKTTEHLCRRDEINRSTNGAAPTSATFSL